MTAPKLIQTTDLSDSLLLSYGGGGNYGDELLLEVVLAMLYQAGVKGVDIAYQHPERYHVYHHDFGYRVVDLWNKRALLGSLLRRKQVVVGGGGLWGLDANRSIFVMSLMLWVARWLLGKKVYLLGVGYYQSTTRLGHVSAFLAAKAAHHIVARDSETYRNFRRFSRLVSQDCDLAWNCRDLDTSAYKHEAELLAKKMPVKGRTLFITMRRFKPGLANNYTTYISRIIRANPDKPAIVALLEPREIDPAGYRMLERWAQRHKHIKIVDFSFNPLALVLFFQRHQSKLAFIGPQFHGLITAHMSNIPLFPLVYDNKSHELFNQLGIASTIHIRDLEQHQLQTFVDWVDEA